MIATSIRFDTIQFDFIVLSPVVLSSNLFAFAFGCAFAVALLTSGFKSSLLTGIARILLWPASFAIAFLGVSMAID